MRLLHKRALLAVEVNSKGELKNSPLSLESDKPVGLGRLGTVLYIHGEHMNWKAYWATFTLGVLVALGCQACYATLYNARDYIGSFGVGAMWSLMVVTSPLLSFPSIAFPEGGRKSRPWLCGIPAGFVITSMVIYLS